jgi:SecD/SecF fusion protein
MPRATFSQIVNRSMSEVLTRSLATSFCTLLPIISLLIFGGETLKDFAFALLVGVASGAYSSIFIASPVLTEEKEREPQYVQRRHRIMEQLGYVPAYAVTTREGVPETAGPADEEARTAPEPVTAGTGVATETRRRRRAARAQPAPEPTPDGGAELDGEGAELEAEPNGAEGAAPVPGGPGSEDGETRKRAVDAVRAERAERKKRARQRGRRKHGRSR